MNRNPIIRLCISLYIWYILQCIARFVPHVSHVMASELADFIGWHRAPISDVYQDAIVLWSTFKAGWAKNDHSKLRGITAYKCHPWRLSGSPHRRINALAWAVRPLDSASLITEIGAQRSAFAEPDRVVITAGTRALCQDLHLARPTLPCVCAEHSLEHRLLSRLEG